jgi:hypothetical protein
MLGDYTGIAPHLIQADDFGSTGLHSYCDISFHGFCLSGGFAFGRQAARLTFTIRTTGR